MKTFVLKNQKVKATPSRFDATKKGRSFKLEIDGINVEFPENSREGIMVQEARMGPRDIEAYFEGGNFSFLNSGVNPEFLDYGLKGSFVLEDEMIAAYEENIGISSRNKDITALVNNKDLPGRSQGVFLGGAVNEVNTHYKSKGEGGVSKLKSVFTWSHHSKLLTLYAAEIRLLCTNGMATTKAVAGNTVMVLNDFERNLMISSEGFLSKVDNALEDRYSRLMQKSLTVRQALTLGESLKNLALLMRQHSMGNEARKIEGVVYNVLQSLSQIYSPQALRDSAFGAAPTNIPAVQSVDILTEALTHYMSRLPDFGGFGLLSAVQKLIQDLMFSESTIFVLPELGEDVKWDPEQDYHFI